MRGNLAFDAEERTKEEEREVWQSASKC